MTDLIVDFPQRACLTPKPETKKRIRFASHMSINYYAGNEGNSSKLHYTSDDYASFKAANRGAVLELSKHYLALASGDERLSHNDADGMRCDLTGLENLFTPNLIQKGSLRKRAHRNAVLDEQRRQDEEGESDQERLAGVSAQQSRRSAQRAAMIGMMHQQIR